MNGWLMWLEEPLVIRLGWTLLHSLWQGALLAVACALVLTTLRGRSPRARYATAAMALLALVLAPAVTFVATAPPAPAASVTPAEIAPVPTTALGDVQRERVAPVEAPAPAAAPPSAAPAAVYDAAPMASANWLVALPVGWLVPAWLAGVGVMALRLLAGWIGTHYLRRRQVTPAETRWQRMLADLAQRLGVRQRVALLCSLRAAGPLTVGWLRPVVLLPVELLRDLTPIEMRILLAHELAHIRRLDYVANLAQAVVEAVLFYHPAAWWLSAQLRHERELCCDDLALEACGERVTYAQTLVRLAEWTAGRRTVQLAATGGRLRTRIEHILGVPSGAASNGRWIAGPLLAASLLGAVLLAPAWLATPAEADEPPVTEVVTADEMQRRGIELFSAVGERCTGWLRNVPADVERYVWAFRWHNDEPQAYAYPNDISNPAYQHGTAYATALHALVRDPAQATFNEIVYEPNAIVVRVRFDSDMVMRVGGGVGPRFFGYFSTAARAGWVRLDRVRLVPLATQFGAVRETFADYVQTPDGRCFPQRVQVQKEGFDYRWHFAVYAPGIWMLDEMRSPGDPNNVDARVELLTVNGQPPMPLAGLRPMDAAPATVDRSVRRVITEAQERVETLIAANRLWLLPSLLGRQGVAYRYTLAEQPYEELVQFDATGAIFAQLQRSPDSPDAPTQQWLLLADGRRVDTRPDAELVSVAEQNPGVSPAPGASPLLDLRRVHTAATGLALECALTRLARDPEAFVARIADGPQVGTYRLILRAPADADLHTGTMNMFTSWAYMHHIRYDRSEILVATDTHQPLEEVDYAGDDVVGRYTFTEYVEDRDGCAPLRIQAVVPHAKDGEDRTLAMDARFRLALPGVWLLDGVRSQFAHEDGPSTARVTLVAQSQAAFPELDDVRERLERSEALCARYEAAPEGQATFDASPDALANAILQAEWPVGLAEAREGDPRRFIGLHAVRLETAADGARRMSCMAVTTVPWKEYEVELRVALLNADGAEMGCTSRKLTLRAESTPIQTLETLELPHVAGSVARVTLDFQVTQLTGMFYGSLWMRRTP